MVLKKRKNVKKIQKADTAKYVPRHAVKIGTKMAVGTQ